MSYDQCKKRHSTVVERFTNLQDSLFQERPDLKGFVYPDYFYKKIAEETLLTPLTVKRIIWNSRGTKKRVSRL